MIKYTCDCCNKDMLSNEYQFNYHLDFNTERVNGAEYNDLCEDCYEVNGRTRAIAPPVTSTPIQPMTLYQRNST